MRRLRTFFQPAIDLAKYKKSVVSILYIVLRFSFCFLPFVVSTVIFLFLGESPELGVAFNVGGNAAMDRQPIQVGVKILVVASCFML